MHVGERRLQKAGALSKAIRPGRSILAECGYSIPFVRVYIKRPVQHVVDTHPLVKLGAFVDDMGQVAFGGIPATRAAIIAAATALVGVARRLKLVISTNCCFIKPWNCKEVGGCLIGAWC